MVFIERQLDDIRFSSGILCFIVGYHTYVATEQGSQHSGSRNGGSRNGGSRNGGSRNVGSRHSFIMELQEYRRVIHTSRTNQNQQGSITYWDS